MIHGAYSRHKYSASFFEKFLNAFFLHSLERLINKAKRVLDTFEPYLGRIEIMGSNSRIERVYFEIRQSHIDQWEKPQIKESKRSFLHSIVNEGGDKEKLESFTNFCEDTIFEMQHAQAIRCEP